MLRRGTGNLARRWVSAAVVLGDGCAAYAQTTEFTQGPDNRRCLNCHGRETMATMPAADRAVMVQTSPGATPRDDPSGLYVSRQIYDYSVHGQTACTSCHPDCDTLPHPMRVQPAQCGGCHERQQIEYQDSVHGQAVAGGNGAGAHCRDCHGTHDVLSSQNPQSRTHKLQLPSTCANCHANPRVMEAAHVREPHAAEQYVDSMHGRGLLEAGLVVAPSCNDCHGVHSIWPATDSRSSVHKDNVPKSCGKCHVGVEQIYRQSMHGKLLEAGDPRGPVCATCHTAHQITAPGEPAFKLLSDERCGQCHADRLERYRETFYGKAMALGQFGVAACYDCHGHHDIVPISDPSSRLSAQNKLQTCRLCHANATE